MSNNNPARMTEEEEYQNYLNCKLLVAVQNEVYEEVCKKNFQISEEDWNMMIRENSGGGCNAFDFRYSKLWDDFCENMRAKVNANPKLKFRLVDCAYGVQTGHALKMLIEMK